MFSFKSVYFVIFTLVLYRAQAKISDKRLCVDANCSELISVGKTLLRYLSPEENVLSFVANENVKIFSYGAGERPELIGVEIKGRRGYINKSHVRETKLIKRPKLLVNTEITKNIPNVPTQGNAGEIKADPTQQPFEIVDGTKIPSDLADLSAVTPVVITGGEQSSSKNTQHISSVPDNQLNIQPPVVPLIKEEENKIKEVPVESHPDEDDEEEDDEEDEEAEDADDVETKETEKSSSTADTPKYVPIVTENLESASKPDENFNQVTETSIGTSPKVEVVQEKADTKKNEKQPVQKSDPLLSEELKNSTDNINLIGNVTESNTINEEHSKPQQFEEHIDHLAANESFQSLLNDPTNIPESPLDAVTDLPSALVQPKNDELVGSLFANSENLSSTVNEEKPKIEPIMEEIKEPTTITTESSLPDATTDIPIEMELVPPVDIESVTLNPVMSDTVPSEEAKYDLPSDFRPTFKDPEETAEVKKETPSGGVLGGLGDIIPMFNTMDNNKNQEEIVQSDEINIPVENFISEAKLSMEEKVDSNSDLVIEDNVVEQQPIVTENEPIMKNLIEVPENMASESGGGFLSEVWSWFGTSAEAAEEESDVVADSLDDSKVTEVINALNENPSTHSPWSFDISSDAIKRNAEVCDSKSEKCPQVAKQGFCDKETEDCYEILSSVVPEVEKISTKSLRSEDLQDLFIEAFSSDMFLYLVTTSLSVLVLIFIWILMDKCRREGPLIARINKLEKQLLATSKENEMLQEKATIFVEEKTQLVVETVPNEVVDELHAKLAEMAQTKMALEEQIQALEKELDTSTEVGIELNKLISEMLNSSDGSEIIKENIEQMQKRVVEQQDTINTLSESLNVKEAENVELQLELEIVNKKVTDLQGEVDKMVEKILRIEEEKNKQRSTLESEITVYQSKCKDALAQEHVLKTEILALNQKVAELQRIADTKVKEYNTLKETLNTLKSVNIDKDAIKSFLNVSEIKAQLQQTKSENFKYLEQLSQERESNIAYTTQIQTLSQEVKDLRDKYEKADKEKVEINTKLEVLNIYFKEKEDQMQKEISKYESLWVAKEGEATSTTERIRYMQEELQNYKAQNESLKQEIMNQEVELKSQISVLEKKSHENWVTSRQTERKFEEARQEAALLRNRLTMRERAIAEGNNHLRMQSPLHQNGELPISSPLLDPTQSPPPLFNPRDHITKSPPIPGMPHPPFLPPPLGGAPFLPPPPLEGMMPPPLGDMSGMPPFIPGLHPGMFPGDHRPPPLGRMSSPPPVGGRYTPESTVYSEYDRYGRRSASPPYDSEYGASPPPIRGYSPYNDRDRLRDDRREYKRPQARSNGRNSKGIHSSGSENDSLGKSNKKPQRKV